jgi:cobalt-zinc-cadmium efflux system outer membrane protein
MNNHKWILLCVSLVMGSMSLIAHAAPVSESSHEDKLEIIPQLTLRDVLEKTFERNPQQYVLQAMDGEVQARYIHARGILPTSPAVSLRHLNDAIGSGRGEREWEADIELPVWLPGQRSARQTLAKDTQAGLAASREGLMLQVAGVLRDAVWDISMNEENAALYDARFKTAQKLEQDVERRYRAGELAKTDLMLAQNETLQADVARLRAAAEVKHAKHRYIVLTGLGEIPANATEPLSSITELSDQHPLIREAETKIGIAQDERGLVVAERRENPQFILSARSQRGAFDNQYNDSIGFKVRIPLDSEVRSAPLIAAAESSLAKVMAERGRLRLTMETMLHEAEHNLEVTRAELELVTQQNQIAQESVRLARKAFSLGETDLVSLLRVQSSAFEAERAVSSRKIQLQWDIARYNQAVIYSLRIPIPFLSPPSNSRHWAFWLHLWQVLLNKSATGYQARSLSPSARSGSSALRKAG